MNFNRCQDTNIFKEAVNPMDSNMNMFDNNCGVIKCAPVMECPRVNCCHRVINYEIPHIIPCQTKVVNHHIYRHTYTPCFSYSEEDEASEVYDQKCC